MGMKARRCSISCRVLIVLGRAELNMNVRAVRPSEDVGETPRSHFSFIVLAGLLLYWLCGRHGNHVSALILAENNSSLSLVGRAKPRFSLVIESLKQILLFAGFEFQKLDT